MVRSGSNPTERQNDSDKWSPMLRIFTLNKLVGIPVTIFFSLSFILETQRSTVNVWGVNGKHNFNIFVLQLFSWIKSVLVCSWRYLLWKTPFIEKLLFSKYVISDWPFQNYSSSKHTASSSVFHFALRFEKNVSHNYFNLELESYIMTYVHR